MEQWDPVLGSPLPSVDARQVLLQLTNLVYPLASSSIVAACDSISEQFRDEVASLRPAAHLVHHVFHHLPHNDLVKALRLVSRSVRALVKVYLLSRTNHLMRLLSFVISRGEGTFGNRYSPYALHMMSLLPGVHNFLKQPSLSRAKVLLSLEALMRLVQLFSNDGRSGQPYRLLFCVFKRILPTVPVHPEVKVVAKRGEKIPSHDLYTAASQLTTTAPAAFLLDNFTEHTKDPTSVVWNIGCYCLNAPGLGFAILHRAFFLQGRASATSPSAPDDQLSDFETVFAMEPELLRQTPDTHHEHVHSLLDNSYKLCCEGLFLRAPLRSLKVAYAGFLRSSRRAPTLSEASLTYCSSLITTVLRKGSGLEADLPIMFQRKMASEETSSLSDLRRRVEFTRDPQFREPLARFINSFNPAVNIRLLSGMEACTFEGEAAFFAYVREVHNNPALQLLLPDWLVKWIPEMLGVALAFGCGCSPNAEEAGSLLESALDRHEVKVILAVAELLHQFEAKHRSGGMTLLVRLIRWKASLQVDYTGNTKQNGFCFFCKGEASGERKPVRFKCPCGAAMYCSHECQTNDWPYHRLECSKKTQDRIA